MARPKRTRVKIYSSWRHVLATILVIAAPLIFLLIFSRITKFAAAELFSDLTASLWRISAAYIVAAFLGWSFAVLFYKEKSAKIALPIFDILQSFPTFAALPIAVMLWGATSLTVILFLVVTIIWPIFFSVISSLKLIKHEWREAVAIEGLRGFNYLKYFLWPVSIPGLITGSIIGLGDGWEAMIATEIIVKTNTGLGNFFQHFSGDTAITAFGILGFLLLIFSINKILWLPLLEWSHRRVEE